MPNRPSKKTTNELWATCGNECANPNCDAEVFKIDPSNKTVERKAQVAHILGSKKGSNRYDPSQSEQARHSFSNLLILCSRCHTESPDGIDIPKNEQRFPPELLSNWKNTHLEKLKIHKDHNWICNPNTAIEFKNGVSRTSKYWIDQQGRPQFYTSEQLAIVTQIFPLLLSFSQINEMLTMIEKTEGKPIDMSHQTTNDAVVGILYKNAKSLVSKDEYGWIGYLAETMQIAQDITLGELFHMWVQDGLKNREKNIQEGKRLLNERTEKTNPLPVQIKIE